MSRKKLYIFNPEHDMALASNEGNYMPPATVRQMRSELSLLPAWYAEGGSYVLANSAYNAGYLDEMCALFDLDVKLMTEPELKTEKELDISPWGWDMALYKQLLSLGMERADLPTSLALNKMRDY